MKFPAHLFLVLALLTGCGGDDPDDLDSTCLADADATYNTCEADCAGDTDCVDACVDTWCDDLVLCGGSEYAEDCSQ